MMTKIKHALFFILGMIYSFCITYVSIFTGNKDESILYTLSILGIIFMSLGILIALFYFFVDNWERD